MDYHRSGSFGNNRPFPPRILTDFNKHLPKHKGVALPLITDLIITAGSECLVPADTIRTAGGTATHTHTAVNWSEAVC